MTGTCSYHIIGTVVQPRNAGGREGNFPQNCEFSPKGLMAFLCFGQCIMYSVHHVWYSWFSEVTKYHLSAPNFF